jgi:hypothetical protein
VPRRPRPPTNSPDLHTSPSSSPTASPPSCWPSPSTPRRSAVHPSCPSLRRRPPLLQPCRHHLLLLAAPTRRLQAGRRSSSSPLAFFRALHVALPLPSSARPPPRPSSAASSSYYSPCPLLILKHVPGCSSTSSIPSRVRCCLLLPLLDYFRRTSAARPSRHLAVAVVSTQEPITPSLFLARCFPSLLLCYYTTS